MVLRTPRAPSSPPEQDEFSPPLPQSLKLGHPRDDAAAGGALAPHQPAWGAAGTPFPPLWDLKVLSCPNVSIRRAQATNPVLSGGRARGPAELGLGPQARIILGKEIQV